MADELEDGLLLDDDLVAFLGDEAASDVESHRALGDAPRGAGAKRTHDEDAAAHKKRKRREQSKAQRRKVCMQRSGTHAEIERDAGADGRVDRRGAAAGRPASRLFRIVAAACLSEAELVGAAGDARITYVAVDKADTAAWILESFSFDKPRTDEHLAAFLRTSTWAWRTTDAVIDEAAFRAPDAPWDKEHGAPRILVVSGNAQRAADLARAVRPLLPAAQSKRQGPAAATREPTVAKLFARHFKVEEQDTWLRAQAAPLAVGTPHRIQALLERGALRLDHAAVLVVDFSWTDAKKRTIFDTPETRDALLKLLADGHVRAAMQRAADPCRLALF